MRKVWALWLMVTLVGCGGQTAVCSSGQFDVGVVEEDGCLR